MNLGTLLFSVALTNFGFSAHAASLEQSLNQQKIETISPVEIQGSQVETYKSPETTGSKICSMLGYTRFVSVSVKTVKGKKGDRFVMVKSNGALGETSTYWFNFPEPLSQDYGLTEEHFLELVNFYCELFRLDEKVEDRKLRRRKQV